MWKEMIKLIRKSSSYISYQNFILLLFSLFPREAIGVLTSSRDELRSVLERWCWWVLAPFQGVAVELGWCRCRSLRDVYGSLGRWGRGVVKKGECLVAQKYVLLSGVYAGVIFSVTGSVTRLAAPSEGSLPQLRHRHRQQHRMHLPQAHPRNMKKL